MQKRRFWQSAVAFFSVAAMVVGQGTLVLAGTTGTVNGDVTDPTTKTPIAGAKVTAASPSQVVTTTTDASGHYAFLSLAPDTYVISVEKSGFQPTSLSGITVVSDQTQVENIQTEKQLRTLATVTSRGSGTLVKSGTTADVYNITPTQQAAAAALGGGSNLNSAYSAISSQPGVTVPISANPTGQQSIFIRGGDYEQTGNEIDGIPINRAFDQYASSPLSNLGNAEVQVYTGAQPADAQASGLAGFINQVIKTGTYPGFSNAQIGVGAPSYYHKFSVETGGATTNRNFSYYLGFLGYNQQSREIDQFNGQSYAPQYGSIINYVAQNCATGHGSIGCYANPGAQPFPGIPLGPNGIVTSNTIFGGQASFADREGIVNLHVGIPHPHDGQKDDVQFLYNVGQTYNTPNDNFGSFDGSLGDVINGTANNGLIPNVGANGCSAMVTTAVACAPGVSPFYTPEQHYVGPLNSRLTAANQFSVETAPFTGQNRNLAFNGGNVPFNQRDGETTGFSIEKIQYQRNFSSNAYARAYVYSNYSDRLDNGIVGLFQNYVGAFSPDYEISSHTRGAALLLADQVDPHNLLSFDAAYTYNSNTRFNNSNPGSLAFGGAQPVIAYLVDSNNPTGGCFNGAATAVSCTAATAAGYKLAGVAAGNALVQRNKTSPVLGTEGGLTCGTGACEYLAINSGGAGSYNTVRPAFTNAAITDIIKPTDKLTVNAALRFEDYTYNLPNENTLGNQLLTNNYNSTHCINASNTISARALNAACVTSKGVSLGSPTTLTANGTTKEDYAHIFSPRLGFTYAVDPTTVVRASFGRFTQGATTAAVDAPTLQASAPSAPFYSNFGFNSYARFVQPEVSFNYDASIEKALPKADVSFKLTPFYRSSQNEFITILVDPKTNFVANINGLSRKAGGVEFAMTRGNFNRDGFAAQLSYTYTNAIAHYKVFPNGGSFVASANTAIQGYNAYTSACGANPKLAECGGGAQTTVAAPCYTTANAPDPTCAAGSVANPYYNAKLVGLLDPGAAYAPYNISLGNSGGGSSSYVVPHVAALILNYKKGPLRITPSFQFQGGTRYGTPFSAQGVAPDSCGAVLGSAVTGDPRYVNGASGGSPYDAQSCTGLVNIPNPQTGKFDGIGAYTQPNLIATNLSVNYDFNKSVGLNVIAANIFNRCFGGTHTGYSTGNIACAYGQNSEFVGNVYNPGDSIQPYVRDSYVPVLGNTALQSFAATSPVPVTVYFNLNFHL